MKHFFLYYIRVWSGSKLFTNVNRKKERERGRETVYAHPFGKIKETNASADRQRKLIFKLTHSHHWILFLQKSICGNALTVSEFQCRSLQKYWSYDMSSCFNIFLSGSRRLRICADIERSESRQSISSIKLSMDLSDLLANSHWKVHGIGFQNT